MCVHFDAGVSGNRCFWPQVRLAAGAFGRTLLLCSPLAPPRSSLAPPSLPSRFSLAPPSLLPRSYPRFSFAPPPLLPRSSLTHLEVILYPRLDFLSP